MHRLNGRPETFVPNLSTVQFLPSEAATCFDVFQAAHYSVEFSRVAGWSSQLF
jgi:hypothetical protein